MTVAGRLLRASDQPLGAVARQVGSRSEFAFAKAFKREFGVAPGGYRRGPQDAPPWSCPRGQPVQLAVEDHQVELAEACGVRDQVDFDDFPAGGRDRLGEGVAGGRAAAGATR